MIHHSVIDRLLQLFHDIASQRVHGYKVVIGPGMLSATDKNMLPTHVFFFTLFLSLTRPAAGHDVVDE